MSRDKQYQALSDELRRQNDEAFGIRSYLNSNNAWVRDATQAIPLADRIPHDAPELYGNDALLRCISRLRPIDYAIHEKTKRDPGEDVALVKFQEEIYKIVDNQKLSDKQKKTEISP